MLICLFANILIFYIGYIASNSVKPLYIIFNKINGYFEENNGSNYENKYLTLTFIDENKETLKM